VKVSRLTVGDRLLEHVLGHGKTEVVARRVVPLLTPGRPDSLVPANIIAFTFTDKAAAELKERILNRTREALGELAGMAEMFVGTIHAFCLELLSCSSTATANKVDSRPLLT
jgi:ATP-dependent exoDNAse (exonuclease V) beta subunit